LFVANDTGDPKMASTVYRYSLLLTATAYSNLLERTRYGDRERLPESRKWGGGERGRLVAAIWAHNLKAIGFGCERAFLSLAETESTPGDGGIY
jgi:hypothetical protein